MRSNVGSVIYSNSEKFINFCCAEFVWYKSKIESHDFLLKQIQNYDNSKLIFGDVLFFVSLVLLNRVYSPKKREKIPILFCVKSINSEHYYCRRIFAFNVNNYQKTNSFFIIFSLQITFHYLSNNNNKRSWQRIRTINQNSDDIKRVS